MATGVSSLNNNKVLLPLLVVFCSALVLLNSVFGDVISVLVLGVIAFVSVFYISYKTPRYNIFILLACSFIMPFLIKALHLFGLPVGMAMEGLCLLMVLTLILNKRIGGIKTLPGILLLCWVSYLVVEIINPNASSRVASFLAIRGLVPMFFGFFIMYSSIETKRDIYIFLGGWFLLSLLAGLYGLYQEFFGLPSYDFAWASHDENLYGALFTWGRLRKFSFFFSPSEFGMLVAVGGMAAFVVTFFAKKLEIRIMSAITFFVCIWVMMYTGSRTAMVLVPVGFGIFALITLNRKVLIAVGCFIVLGTILILRPSGNSALFIMSTAFQGTEDPSMNVRIRNQERIRSYIHANPIGFGLGSTGYLGMKYSPHTFVGSFPPDSEYVKIAIETGWIGLFFWMTILAIAFGYGIWIYFKTRDPDWRLILTVALTAFFMLIVGQYPQEIFFTSQGLSLLFSGMIGIMAKVDYKLSPKRGTDEYEGS